MEVWTMIARSYSLPFERIGSLVRVFWPIAVTLSVATFAIEYAIHVLITPEEIAAMERAGGGAMDGPVLFALFGTFLALALAIVMGASALIRWHRHLVAGVPAETGRFLLSKHEWQFVWRWCWLSGIYLAVTLLMMAACLITLVIIAPDAIEHFGTGMEGDKSGWLLVWVLIIAIGLVGWMYPRSFLALPAIALDEAHDYWRNSVHFVTAEEWSALRLGILATSAPFVFLSALPMTFPLETPTAFTPTLSFAYLAVLVVSYISSFLGMIVFATMLSLAYRIFIVDRRNAPHATASP